MFFLSGTKGRNIKKIALPCQKCDFVAKSAGYLKKHMLKHERNFKKKKRVVFCPTLNNNYGLGANINLGRWLFYLELQTGVSQNFLFFTKTGERLIMH